MSKLVLMGSGETAPSLVSLHRRLLSGLASVKACWFDTPYGFQENRRSLSQKTVEFFRTSLQHDLNIASFPNSDIPEADKQRAYGVAQNSNYLFSGPGSPSYALKQWRDSALPVLFSQKLTSDEDNVVIFASATACTVGRYCLPVYEIYKVGEKPHWLDGLDLLAGLGFQAVVLPHFNNTVGGDHDTRFCYLGETRLRQLEARLEPETWIWGIDEHTALVIDLTTQRFEVVGKASLTLRCQGRCFVFANGHQGPLDELRHPGEDNRETDCTVPACSGASAPTQGLITAAAAEIEKRYQTAFQKGESQTLIKELLAYEQLLDEWSGDTDLHHRQLARAGFRRLIEELQVALEGGLQDPKAMVCPWVESLLAVRRVARDEKLWSVADVIRDELIKHNIEVRDDASGSSVWGFRQAALR